MISVFPPPAKSTRILIIDNYDSFVYNLFQFFGELTGEPAKVIRNDKVTVQDVQELRPSHIVISPGPGSPDDPRYFGVCRELILKLGETTPVLGVCLGHQGIGYAFGAKVVRAPLAMHGKTSTIRHDGTGVFKNLQTPLTIMRYHSLVVQPDSLPACLRVTATTEDGVIMGMVHRTLPIQGVQFHPESIGSQAGLQMLRNFLDARPTQYPLSD